MSLALGRVKPIDPYCSHVFRLASGFGSTISSKSSFVDFTLCLYVDVGVFGLAEVFIFGSFPHVDRGRSFQGVLGLLFHEGFRLRVVALDDFGRCWTLVSGL